ncbi:unnamed protein product [Phytomonas sp. Hart1]|nr:unnamed protein product [Phytomonas sp. Hart1]|eukprot:CCW67008.1 unnamed protein product [Phytomonas sp. isolate Hart1]
MGFISNNSSNTIASSGKNKPKNNRAESKDSLKSKIVHKLPLDKLEVRKGQLQSANVKPTFQERYASTVEVSKTAPVEQIPAEVRMNSVSKEDIPSDISIHFSCTYSVTSSSQPREGAGTREDDLGALEVTYNKKNIASEYNDEINFSLDHSNKVWTVMHGTKPTSYPGTPKPSSIALAKQRNDSTRGLKGINRGAASDAVESYLCEHVSECSSILTEFRSIGSDREQTLTNKSEDSNGNLWRQANKVERTPIFRSEGVGLKRVTAKKAQHSSHLGENNSRWANVQPYTLYGKTSTCAAVTPDIVPRKRLTASNRPAEPSLNPNAHVYWTTRDPSHGVKKERSISMSSEQHSTNSGQKSSHLSKSCSHYLLQNRKKNPHLYGDVVSKDVVDQCKEGIAPELWANVSKHSEIQKKSQRLNQNVPLRPSPRQQNKHLHDAEVNVRYPLKVMPNALFTQRSRNYPTPERQSEKRAIHHPYHNHMNSVDAEYEPLWGSSSSTLSPPPDIKSPSRTPVCEGRSFCSSYRSSEHQSMDHKRDPTPNRSNISRSASPSDCRSFSASLRRHAEKNNPNFRGYSASHSMEHRLPRHSARGEKNRDQHSMPSGFSHRSSSWNSSSRPNPSLRHQARTDGLSRRYVKNSPTRLPSHRTSLKAASSIHLSPQRELQPAEEKSLLDEVQHRLEVLADEIATRDDLIEQDMRASPWQRLYHHSNRRDGEERRALEAQQDKLENICRQIENGTINAGIRAREERRRRQEELLRDPNGVYLRLYNARQSTRASEGSPNTSQASYQNSTSGSARSGRPKRPGEASVLRGRSNGSARASASVSARSGNKGSAGLQRTEAQRAAFFSNMYTRAMDEVRRKEKKAQAARQDRAQHDLEEFAISRLAARVELDHLRRHFRNTDPLAVAQRKWKTQASKDDSAVQAFIKEIMKGPKLSSSEQKNMVGRLNIHGYVKPETLKKKREEQEIKGCTFHPCIINYPGLNRSARGNSASSKTGKLKTRDNSLNKNDSSEGKPPGQRNDRKAAEKRCNNLYKNALQGRKKEEERRKEYEQVRRLDILKSRLSTDHHFRRRVELNPSLAEHFMNSLSV